MAALPAARLGLIGSRVPFVVEFRDLWAGHPAYDKGGRLLRAVEHWVVSRADVVMAVTPEATSTLRGRYEPRAGVREVPNGFEPELLDRRAEPSRNERIVIIHSGTLIPERPLGPLLEVLREQPYTTAFRLLLHGHLTAQTARDVATMTDGCDVEVWPPSSWEEAIARISDADVALVTQAREAGDATAIAAKVYEYMALGKPVLCITDGGATEALVRRLGGGPCARLDDEGSIRRALDRLMRPPPLPAVPAERLEPFNRRVIARRMAEVLDERATTVARNE